MGSSKFDTEQEERSSNPAEQTRAGVVKAWHAPVLTEVDLAKATLLQAGGATDCCLGS